MPRPRGFDEGEVVRRAAALFASRAYDGVSVDDLVNDLGMHRNSLYKTFGSKRGLYLAALGWQLSDEVAPLVERVAGADDPAGALADRLADQETATVLDLLLIAAVERAPVDREVAVRVEAVLATLDAALAGSGTNAATFLGVRIKDRIRDRIKQSTVE